MGAETAGHAVTWEDRFAAVTRGRSLISRDLDERAAEQMGRAVSRGGVR